MASPQTGAPLHFSDDTVKKLDTLKFCLPPEQYKSILEQIHREIGLRIKAHGSTVSPDQSLYLDFYAQAVAEVYNQALTDGLLTIEKTREIPPHDIPPTYQVIESLQQSKLQKIQVSRDRISLLVSQYVANAKKHGVILTNAQQKQLEQTILSGFQENEEVSLAEYERKIEPALSLATTTYHINQKAAQETLHDDQKRENIKTATINAASTENIVDPFSVVAFRKTVNSLVDNLPPNNLQRDADVVSLEILKIAEGVQEPLAILSSDIVPNQSHPAIQKQSALPPVSLTNIPATIISSALTVVRSINPEAANAIERGVVSKALVSLGNDVASGKITTSALSLAVESPLWEAMLAEAKKGAATKGTFTKVFTDVASTVFKGPVSDQFILFSIASKITRDVKPTKNITGSVEGYQKWSFVQQLLSTDKPKELFNSLIHAFKLHEALKQQKGAVAQNQGVSVFVYFFEQAVLSRFSLSGLTQKTPPDTSGALSVAAKTFDVVVFVKNLFGGLFGLGAESAAAGAVNAGASAASKGVLGVVAGLLGISNPGGWSVLVAMLGTKVVGGLWGKIKGFLSFFYSPEGILAREKARKEQTMISWFILLPMVGVALLLMGFTSYQEVYKKPPIVAMGDEDPNAPIDTTPLPEVIICNPQKQSCTWPVGGTITQGPGGDYSHNKASTKNAIDISASNGTAVVATCDGKAILQSTVSSHKTSLYGTCALGAKGCNGGWGNKLIFQCNDGREYLYAHLFPDSWLQPNQPATIGQEIAQVDNNGNSSGPHLHWQLLNAGLNINSYVDRVVPACSGDCCNQMAAKGTSCVVTN